MLNNILDMKILSTYNIFYIIELLLYIIFIYIL